MDEVRWLSDDEQDLWRKTLYFRQLLDLAIDRQLQRDAGLSAADYTVLVALSEAEGACLRFGELGATLRWNPSRLSHQVRRMGNRGLVEKSACANDGRGMIVNLTEEGRAAIEASAPQHVEQVRQLYIDMLDEDERELLASVFERVIEQIIEVEELDD